MAKRRAGSELTDKNWDQEDEPEEVNVSFYFSNKRNSKKL
jgi:hypothetical protein